MAGPSRKDLKANQNYLKTWDDYQQTSEFDGPILLPISISIEDGIIKRGRIKVPQLNEMLTGLRKDFITHCKFIKNNYPDCHSVEDFDAVIEDYIKEFESQDTAQSSRPDSPLDFQIGRPVWMFFYLPDDSWTFTKSRQYSMENDRDDVLRNVEKICTMADESALLLTNYYRSGPKGLKYNLHVTISQKVDGKSMETDIIIDPAARNDEGRGP